MVMKAKTEFKDVFSGLASLYLSWTPLASFDTLNFDVDLPVTIDTLTMSQGEPTLNETKVHGLQTSWAVTSTPGEFSFGATVPSISKELVSRFMGGAKDVTASTVNGEAGWSGFSTTIKNVKLNVGLALCNEAGDKLIAVKNMAIYATPQYENGSTTPFGFLLTGSIEASEGANSDNIAFLKKTETPAV